MNISKIHNCYGCGVCAVVCSQKIIEIDLNTDGFYEPHITNASKCTNCGLCVDVCAYSHDELSVDNKPLKSYAAWSKEPAVRRKCSSGGVGFEIGRYLINQGYKVCGVRYNVETKRAEHYIANNVEELIPSMGGKYIQSYTVDGFKAINRKEKYLVTGTPCQIDSFRRYIRKFKKEDNFILMDFFCHGVPSMLIWDKYVKWAETKVGKLTYVSWRNKFTGWYDPLDISISEEKEENKVNWHDSYNMLVSGEKSFYNSQLLQGDYFYRLFFSDACLSKACYENCRFKYNKSSADIRIGDLWGKTYNDNEEGVSATIAFTEKGNNILKESNCSLIEYPFDVVAEGQMKTCPKRQSYYKKLSNVLIDKTASLQDVINVLNSIQFKQKMINRLNHPIRTINNILRRIHR